METHQDYRFSHEKLAFYQESIAFVAWVCALLESTTRALAT